MAVPLPGSNLRSIMGFVRILSGGRQELTADILDETWISLRTQREGEVLKVSLVEAAELIDLLRGQVALLAFGMDRTRRALRQTR